MKIAALENIEEGEDDQVQIPLRRDRARDEIELELSDEPPACKRTRTQNEAIGWRPGELELVKEWMQERLRALEQELTTRAHDLHSFATGSPTTPRPVGPPRPLHTLPISPSFEVSRSARTEARVRQFCSLNAAGYALCAWHRTRREPRAYRRRAAPPGTLNCGCMHEEALFEESLARNGVGAYHPGESVRMEPALRNPLLRLLQERYGYRDGDFERDPITGGWKNGEASHSWENPEALDSDRDTLAAQDYDPGLAFVLDAADTASSTVASPHAAHEQPMSSMLHPTCAPTQHDAPDSHERLWPINTWCGLLEHVDQLSVVQPVASSSRHSQQSPEDELHVLHRRVRELEVAIDSVRLRVRTLERELAGDNVPHVLIGAGAMAPAHPLISSSSEVSWSARTEARIRYFCLTPNRRGYLVCAWHSTRRCQPRWYRAAAAGRLQCGCTYEEALLEESLARHGVGVYHSSVEGVHMDPELRNALLLLLQKCYDYRDGEFERDGSTGEWKEGEGPLDWQQRPLPDRPQRRPNMPPT
jgi:hypothetical protein